MHKERIIQVGQRQKWKTSLWSTKKVKTKVWNLDLGQKIKFFFSKKYVVASQEVIFFGYNQVMSMWELFEYVRVRIEKKSLLYKNIW